MDLKEKAEQIARECCRPVTAEDYNHYIASIEKALEEASTKDTERLDYLDQEWSPDGEWIAVMEMERNDKFSLDNGRTWHDTLRQAIDSEMKDSHCIDYKEVIGAFRTLGTVLMESGKKIDECFSNIKSDELKEILSELE